MAGTVGRQVRLLFGGNSPGDEIPGVREKGATFNSEPIDVTSDENGGIRTLIENATAERQIEVSISGVTKDTRIKQAWINSQYSQPIRLEYPDGTVLAGTFHLSSYEEGYPYNDATTFSATLMNNGDVSFS